MSITDWQALAFLAVYGVACVVLGVWLARAWHHPPEPEAWCDDCGAWHSGGCDPDDLAILDALPVPPEREYARCLQPHLHSPQLGSVVLDCPEPDHWAPNDRIPLDEADTFLAELPRGELAEHWAAQDRGEVPEFPWGAQERLAHTADHAAVLEDGGTWLARQQADLAEWREAALA